MKYKIFVMDADDEKTVYKTEEYEIQDGVLKIIDGVFYLDKEGKFSDEKGTVAYPLHRVLEIDYIED